ncbi:Zinc phosphodiesterase ELAC protein 1-like [Homarus americanus]|uniref:Zinc phosphodiesterase ELAC protein 1-like n=1 Tax=Homarus americanus TaxID=6706 RepID=A0A8J5TKA7_HOMAM|nr:Zinc phosphodiesterase ELAC protein 1-like [Homarus americanus]
MKLHFLGTGSSYPTTRRGVSATALQHDDGCVWLFDCGEGTQIQAQKVAVSRQKINKIFITHLHGDHIFGLPGLLCTISSQMGLVEEQVHELVPEEVQHTQGGEDFRVDICSETTCHPSQLPGTHIRATSDTIGNFHWQLIDDERWCVSAGWIHHRVPTFGYVIKEKDRPGTLDTNKLLSLGIKPGPVYGQLKGGKSVTTENGERVTPEMVVGPAIPGRTVVILGDTSDASPLAHLVESCDVVVHEATHDDTLKDKALEFGHSTPSQAVHFAKTISAKTLLLNHFSQRYLPTCKEATKNEESIALLEEQALTAAEGTTLHVQCTDDLFVYDMPSHPRHNVQT